MYLHNNLYVLYEILKKQQDARGQNFVQGTTLALNTIFVAVKFDYCNCFIYTLIKYHNISTVHFRASFTGEKFV